MSVGGRADVHSFLTRVNGELYRIDSKHWAKAKELGGGRIDELERLWWYEQTCKMAAFMPHGIARHSGWLRLGDVIDLPPSLYGEESANDGVAALNDWDNDGILICGPNQVGKSLTLTILTALKIIPCDPSWPLFTDGPENMRVKWHEWGGPKKWIVASYTWDNVRTLWNHIREWFPRWELRQYAPSWGKFDGETGKPLNMNFGDGRPKELNLACGSVVKFLCYKQEQCHWEGFNCDGGSFDEQAPKERWIGWKRGTTTRGDYTPFIMALTGHCVEGRPDTGAGGWIKRELWDGGNTQGHKIGKYQLSIETAPKAVISEERRKALWTQWCDPGVRRSVKDERASIARYWGGWEEGGGLMFDSDCWDKRIHVIDPIWEDDDVPSDWTKWRVIDYGDNGVTCCSWMASGPKGFHVCYRVLYEKGLLVRDSAKKIIEMSGNVMLLMDTVEDEYNPGNYYSVYKEDVRGKGEVFYAEIIDGRSAAQNKQGPTLIELFARYGLTNLQPANAQFDDIQIPRLKDLMRIDYSRPHPFNKDETGKPLTGCSQLYFFAGRADAAIVEINECPAETKKGTPMHAIDTLKYWASDNPVYMGDAFVRTSHKEEDRGNDGLPFTGYRPA